MMMDIKKQLILVQKAMKIIHNTTIQKERNFIFKGMKKRKKNFGAMIHS